MIASMSWAHALMLLMSIFIALGLLSTKPAQRALDRYVLFRLRLARNELRIMRATLRWQLLCAIKRRADRRARRRMRATILPFPSARCDRSADTGSWT